MSEQPPSKPSATENKPTAEEKATIAEYVQHLKARGFCKIDSAAQNRTQLFNRYADERDAIRSFAYIDEDFSSWLHKYRRECEFRSVPYIVRTLPHIVGTKFVPGGKDFHTDKRTGFHYANTYRRFEPSESSADVSPLLHEFFERLAPIEAERRIFLQYIGHMFQRPGDRPSFHILIPSDPGTGKGFLMQAILTPLLHHTVVARNFRAVMGQFSSVLESSLLVLLDDCKSSSDNTQTQLKSILSEERQYIERKHQQGTMVPTYTRFILASNEEKPLHLEEGERRWFALSRAVHRVDRFETQAFIQQLADWLALPGSLCKVYNYFMSIDLTGFNPKSAPASAELERIIGMSRNPYAEFIAEYTEDRKLFTRAELIAALQAEGLSKPSDQHLPHLIREAGYERSRPIVNGKQHSGIYHPEKMPLQEIRAALESVDF